jgi:histidinol-phosphate aminotransferase
MTNNYTKILNSLPSSIPFVGPEAQERILDKFFDSRIGANESVFGPSLEALKVMKAELTSLWMYGDPENYDLKIEIAKKHNVKPENIIIGEGIDGLLGYLVRMFVEPKDKVVTTDGSYPTFNYHVNGYGGKLKKFLLKMTLKILIVY